MEPMDFVKHWKRFTGIVFVPASLTLLILFGFDWTESPLKAKAIIPSAAAPSGAVDPVAARLQSLVTSQIDQFVPRASHRAGIARFYRERSFAPLWIEKGEFSALAVAARHYLSTVAGSGLDPAVYRIPLIEF